MKLIIQIINFILAVLILTSCLIIWNHITSVKPEIIITRETIKEVPAKLSYQTFEVTAYTAGIESTGKTPNDKMFGITASGEMALERITLACPFSMEFGTKIYIPAFDSVFTCQDRGSAITEGKLDVYMEDVDRANMFGRQQLMALILP